MNKGISTPVGIIIIVLVVLLVGGILAWQCWWMPEEEETAQDETADWKTYTNEEYGFEVKHPKEGGVYFDELAGGIHIDIPFASEDFLKPEDPLVTPNIQKYLLIGVDQGIERCSISRKAIIQESDQVQVGGIEFKKEISEEYRYGAYVIGYSTVHNQQCFRLSFIIQSSIPISSSLPESKFEREIQIYSQMLSTFRFLEQE
ncbi:MAG: hypothetical protein ABIG08_03035 [bacterium]